MLAVMDMADWTTTCQADTRGPSRVYVFYVCQCLPCVLIICSSTCPLAPWPCTEALVGGGVDGGWLWDAVNSAVLHVSERTMEGKENCGSSRPRSICCAQVGNVVYNGSSGWAGLHQSQPSILTHNMIEICAIIFQNENAEWYCRNTHQHGSTDR